MNQVIINGYAKFVNLHDSSVSILLNNKESFKKSDGDWQNTYTQIRCIGFGKVADQMRNIQKEQFITIIGKLSENTYQEKTTLQIIVESITVAPGISDATEPVKPEPKPKKTYDPNNDVPF